MDVEVEGDDQMAKEVREPKKVDRQVAHQVRYQLRKELKREIVKRRAEQEVAKK